jgi:hypothetical protein
VNAGIRSELLSHRIEDTVDEALSAYWDNALSLVSRQLVSAMAACAFVEEPPSDSQRSSLQDVADRLRGSTPKAKVPDSAAHADRGHLIRADDPRFEEALEWLQQELRTLLEHQPGEGYEAERSKIEKILHLSPLETEQHFGTLTDGWDKLVSLKHTLLLPDRVDSQWSSWFIGLMADFERSLRGIVCLTIQHLGRSEPVRTAILETERAMDIPGPTAGSALGQGTAEAAVADAFSSYMARGVGQTVRVAAHFCGALEVRTAELDSYARGFVPRLGEFGDSTMQIIDGLIGWRRRLLHNVTSVEESDRGDWTATDPSLRRLRTSSTTYGKTIVQFLYGYSVHAALGIMDVISASAETADSRQELASVARYKAACELRHSDLELLKKELWLLAWALAENVRTFEYEEQSKLMLQFNLLYAQSELEIPGWREEVESIGGEESAPRYKIVKKTLLQRWDGMEELIAQAMFSRDMTADELLTWPVLRRLRERGTIDDVVKGIASGSISA